MQYKIYPNTSHATQICMRNHNEKQYAGVGAGCLTQRIFSKPGTPKLSPPQELVRKRADLTAVNRAGNTCLDLANSQSPAIKTRP